MKLSNDKKLIDFLVEKNKEQRAAYGERALIKLWLSDADQYLEEHGFHIYPVKTEKRFSLSDHVSITDKTHERCGEFCFVVGKTSKTCKVEFADGRTSIIPNEFLEFTGASAKEKGTVSFKEIEEEEKKKAFRAWLECMYIPGAPLSTKHPFSKGEWYPWADGIVDEVTAKVKALREEKTSAAEKDYQFHFGDLSPKPKPSADGEEMLLSGKTIISIEHYERRG